MKWFMNMKIGSKLILGFVLIAIICGGIGTVGLISINEIGNVRLVSVEHLQEVMISLSEVGTYMEMEMNTETTFEERQKIYEEVNALIDEYQVAADFYQSMAKSEEDQLLWDEIQNNYTQWYGYFKTFNEDLNKIDVQGIDNPQEVRLQITMKKRDHVSWIWQLLTAINEKNEFKGQLDGNLCALGKWLGEYDPRSEQFQVLMKEIEASHLLVHSSGKEITELIAVGDETSMNKAKLIYESTTLTNMNNVLSILDEMDAMTVDVESIYASLNENMAQNIDPSYDKLFTNVQALVDRNVDATNNQVKSSIVLVIGFIIGGIMLSVSLGLIISNMVKNPINKMVIISQKMADGNFDVTIDVNSKDEIGTLGKAFSQMVENINDVMSNIDMASDQVALGSRQVSDSSMALSQGATEQASSIEELTATVEEIATQTRINSINADKAKELATSAQKYAQKGNEQMGDMINAMAEINDSSNNISKIIKVIDDIAFQTNILALNAAVEAARAGQHGKGFAVVAEEVRNLAARSANAANETTDMIEGSIKKVEVGTKIANETAEALNMIVDGISSATELVSKIAIASKEQAIGVDQINQGISQISDVVQTTSATAEETAASSEELSSQADMLKSQVATFKLKRRFKR